MLNNKKGLSDVITTVLIILLVLAAVVLIWTFISNQIADSTKQIDQAAECLKVQVSPVSCTPTGTIYYTYSGGSPYFKHIVGVGTNNLGATTSSAAENIGASLSGTVSVTPAATTTLSTARLIPVLNFGPNGNYSCSQTAQINCQ